MGISVNTDKLEDLRKLQTFFEFISNPQAYKDFLKDTKAVLAGMDEKISIYNTVEKAEAYLRSAEAKMAEVNQAVADFNQQLAASAEAATLRHTQDQEELAVVQSRLDAQKAELEVQQNLLVTYKSDYVTQMEQLIQREQACSIKEGQLDVREAELDATKAKLAALLK